MKKQNNKSQRKEPRSVAITSQLSEYPLFPTIPKHNKEN